MVKHLSRNDLERGLSKPGKHLFYRMEMPFQKTLDQLDELKFKLDQSAISKEVKIKNLIHPDDTLNFMFLYNAIFIAAPDPSRTITLEDAEKFPSDRTFIATLWHSFAGFIYLTVEKDPMGSEEIVGAIAGIGVLPKNRGRKIGLKLIKHAIEYFKNKNIEKLICEIYERNQASLNLFKGMGMDIVGEMILEEEQPNKSNF